MEPLLKISSSPPHSNLQSHNSRCLPWRTKLFFNPNSHRVNLLCLPQKLSSKVLCGLRFDGPVMEMGEVSTMEDGDLVVETCITRTLPPSLTLEKGLQSIKEAVEELKLNPPCTSSGFFRFQVAVPPSAKALDWFCCQPESSRVFPLFFISKDSNNPDYKSLHLNETRGVFGVGAAVNFKRASYCTTGEPTKTKRYLSNESTLVMAYGFMDINFLKELSFMKHEEGSYNFFIPQIQLDEHEGTSILAATLAWCDSSLCTFEEAICSYELSFNQATCHICSTEKCRPKSIISTFRKFNVVEDRTLSMVYMNTLLAGRKYVVNDFTELVQKELPSSRQFCIRLSPTVAVSSNMLDHGSDKCYSMQDCTNINTVWASLLIEECSRNDLMYFCVAPGSRSSPLAVAASTHPLITCIVCYDERSLAFHAVGYGRGSRKPAVIITSSGTAVSNLLPAVVEAYQDFVPLLLLTADRPAELHNVGANQAINQINHFGTFVRFFFSLPAPTDCVPARMVLTTIDSAVYWATSSPCGPVHINCPFREPLENSPSKWTRSCLKGLNFWMSSSEPFTKYIQLQHSHAEISEVVNVIRKANRGLLIVGAIHTEDEIWAILHLAKHLLWPVLADILSGLRLRKFLIFFPEVETSLVFVDHLDHVLLSEFVTDWIHVDVVIQIGSRITSKRVLKMLEESSSLSYVMVDNHPFRYDPSHIVTHRVHSSIVKFADYLLKVEFPCKNNEWSSYLQALNVMVARELSFQIHAEYSLTEPLVAYTISEALSTESAIFIGNSMVIRDADMYGCGWSKSTRGIQTMPLDSELPCHLIMVAGNRGASGIDGLLSSAVGYAVGCNKRVFCVIGDVSFLHDTNGLAILSQRTLRKPMTILVINNHGGAIFSLLPIADRVEPEILNKYFYTSHNVSIRELCTAHGVKHLEVRTKAELHDALLTSQHEEMDHVIEVEGCIDVNSTFHSTLRKFARLAANQALSVIQRLSVLDDLSLCKVHRMEYSLFRIQLCAPPSMMTVDYDRTSFYREGFILSLYLEDGSLGYGEVAPLDFHRENLQGVEEQLRFILHVIKGVKISCFIPLLKGSFSSWIWTSLGIPPSSLFPSVRCGLEMAILNAIAARQGCSLLSILHSWKEEVDLSKGPSRVKICGLVDSNGTPTEVADIVAMLVEEGFAAIKLKVARQRSPMHDAEVIQEVRKKIGQHIELRVDANQNWTFQEAIQFGSLVQDCNLQYIEEPVKDKNNIIQFCEESGLPVALDETIHCIQENPLNMLAKYDHPGIVAIVIKPSVVGGFENAALIAQWAQQHGKMAVVSATFESGLGLSAYIHFSCYLDQRNAEICEVINNKLATSIAHGLGTYRWLNEDVATTPLNINLNPYSGYVEASVADANQLLESFQINHQVVQRNFTGEEVCRYQMPVDSTGFSCLFNIHEIGQISNDNVLVFLHGFLGTGEDWIGIMKTISGWSRCILIDLPGHGGTKIQNHGNKDTAQEPNMSIEVVADVISKLIHHITPGKVTVVGYSMGARIALHMALRFTHKVKGAVVISGSPGLKDEAARKVRKAKDDSKARFLVAYGLQLFLENWYSGHMWNSLRGHPKFKQIVASRGHHEDVHSLAKLLSDSSVGRQLPLWEDLKHHSKTPLLFIVGEKDSKFKTIAQEMCSAIDSGEKTGGAPPNGAYDIAEIPNSGHAPHLENPLPVIAALRQFVFKIDDENTVNF